MFATVNYCIQYKNSSRCHETVSVTKEFANALQKRIDRNGSYNFVVNDELELNQVIICEYTEEPKCKKIGSHYLTNLVLPSL